MRCVSLSVFCFVLGLALAVPARAQFSPLTALSMLGEAAGVNRHQVHRANRRQKAKERQEVAATLEATRSEKTALARTAVGHLARCAERARNGALELENPGEVAVAFLEKLQDPDWKTRWQACRGLVALGYSPSQIQGWLQGTMTLPAPRLGQKGT